MKCFFTLPWCMLQCCYPNRFSLLFSAVQIRSDILCAELVLLEIGVYCLFIVIASICHRRLLSVMYNIFGGLTLPPPRCSSGCGLLYFVVHDREISHSPSNSLRWRYQIQNRRCAFSSTKSTANARQSKTHPSHHCRLIPISAPIPHSVHIHNSWPWLMFVVRVVRPTVSDRKSIPICCRKLFTWGSSLSKWWIEIESVQRWCKHSQSMVRLLSQWPFGCDDGNMICRK